MKSFSCDKKGRPPSTFVRQSEPCLVTLNVGEGKRIGIPMIRNQHFVDKSNPIRGCASHPKRTPRGYQGE